MYYRVNVSSLTIIVDGPVMSLPGPSTTPDVSHRPRWLSSNVPSWLPNTTTLLPETPSANPRRASWPRAQRSTTMFPSPDYQAAVLSGMVKAASRLVRRVTSPPVLSERLVPTALTLPTPPRTLSHPPLLDGRRSLVSERPAPCSLVKSSSTIRLPVRVLAKTLVTRTVSTMPPSVYPRVNTGSVYVVPESKLRLLYGPKCVPIHVPVTLPRPVVVTFPVTRSSTPPPVQLKSERTRHTSVATRTLQPPRPVSRARRPTRSRLPR